MLLQNRRIKTESSLPLFKKADYMERELLITVKRSNYDSKKVDREVAYIKTLFPFLESFETFIISNQVFDLEHRSVVHAKQRLMRIFNEGIQKNKSFIVSLN
jgi:hypothetical protein